MSMNKSEMDPAVECSNSASSSSEILRGLELLFGGLARIHSATPPVPAAHVVGAAVQHVPRFETIIISQTGNPDVVLKTPTGYQPAPMNNAAGLRKLFAGLNELLTPAATVGFPKPEAAEVRGSESPLSQSQHPTDASSESHPQQAAESIPASALDLSKVAWPFPKSPALDTESESKNQTSPGSS